MFQGWSQEVEATWYVLLFLSETILRGAVAKEVTYSQAFVEQVGLNNINYQAIGIILIIRTLGYAWLIWRAWQL